MAASKEIVPAAPNASTDLATNEASGLAVKLLASVREEVADCPYIREALKVLPVEGYRSAIGSIWNAVVDDLRKKILHRSVGLFNKSVPSLRRVVKTYEDFQEVVNDEELIEGAYKIGVINWEARKVLKTSRDARHLFDGHPASSDPSPIKVLSIIDDCVKYVLSQPMPPQVVDIDDYLKMLEDEKFDQSVIAIEAAITSLPEIYRNELVHKIFGATVGTAASSVFRRNAEKVLRALWSLLAKETKAEVVRRVDSQIQKGNAELTARAFEFVESVDGQIYLSQAARRYRVLPLIEVLEEKVDEWADENQAVDRLRPLAGYIPSDLVSRYVLCITRVYIGYTGASGQWSRTDFYANGAAVVIPGLFGLLDDAGVDAFVNAIRTDERIRRRIGTAIKLERLRTLARIALDRASPRNDSRVLLEALLDPDREGEFRRLAGFATEE